MKAIQVTMVEAIRHNIAQHHSKVGEPFVHVLDSDWRPMVYAGIRLNVADHVGRRPDRLFHRQFDRAMGTYVQQLAA